MNSNEIKKALESMVKFADTVDRSVLDAVDVQLLKDTLDLINQYEAEIKSKQETIDSFTDIGKLYSEIKAEAIKEFAKLVYKMLTTKENWDNLKDEWIENGECGWLKRRINNLLKEMGVNE